MANRYANIPGASKINQSYNLITEGFDKVEQEMDAKPDASIAQVNNIAFDADDTLTIEGGTGIAVTTNPNNKKVTITATGTSTPGAHGSSHTEFGADPIPNATTTEGGLMSAADKTRLDGATSTATPNTIVQRDAQGRIKAAAPAAADDVARKAEVDAVSSALTAHVNDVQKHITHLAVNQYTVFDPVTSYPLGVSVMRVTDSDFPNKNGTVLTVKGTSGTGFQIFVSTTSNIGSYFRGSTNEVWKDWEPIVKDGKTLWSGSVHQSNTVLTLTDDINKYSYLVFVVSLTGYESRLAYHHKEQPSIFIKGLNLSDSGTSTNLYQVEMRFDKVSDTEYKLTHNIRWFWSGKAGEDATVSLDDSNFSVKKIIGVI